MKYCEKCGAEMHDEAVMCVKCGNMTSNNQNSKPKVETTEKYCTKCGGESFFRKHYLCSLRLPVG